MNRKTTTLTHGLSGLALTWVLVSGAAVAQQDPGAARGQEPQDSARQSAEDVGKQKSPARVDVRSQQPFGAYVVDARGMSLYLFEPDKAAEGSTCYGECARIWPPLLSEGDPRAAAPSLDGEKLGTIERRDGSQQVTYAGWPLYLYAPDKSAGDTRGQDVHSFGGGWYLISADGQKIEATKPGGSGAQKRE